MSQLSSPHTFFQLAASDLSLNSLLQAYKLVSDLFFVETAVNLKMEAFLVSITVYRGFVLLAAYLSLVLHFLFIISKKLEWWNSFFLDYDLPEQSKSLEVAWFVTSLVQLLVSIPMLIGTHSHKVQLITPWLWYHSVLLLFLLVLISIYFTWVLGVWISSKEISLGMLLSGRPFKHLVLYLALFAVNAVLLVIVKSYTKRLRKAKNLDDIHIESLSRLKTKLTPKRFATVKSRTSLYNRSSGQNLGKDEDKTKDISKKLDSPRSPKVLKQLELSGTPVTPRRSGLENRHLWHEQPLCNASLSRLSLASSASGGDSNSGRTKTNAYGMISPTLLVPNFASADHGSSKALPPDQANLTMSTFRPQPDTHTNSPEFNENKFLFPV